MYNLPWSLLKFDDGRGHTLPCAYRLARDPTTAPFLVCFHGWLGVSRAYRTMQEESIIGFPVDSLDWTVIVPQDRYGFARGGCWWLGTNGDFFMLSLLDGAIEHLVKLHNLPRDKFHVWGMSMGGFGALLYGLRLGAKAICVNVPQVCLLGTEYPTGGGRMLRTVFGDEPYHLALGKGHDLSSLKGRISDEILLYRDVTNFINYEDPKKNPMIFIYQNRFDFDEHYTDEQCFYLCSKLLKAKTNFALQVVPNQGHDLICDVNPAIELFEKHRGIIETPLGYAPVASVSASTRVIEQTFGKME